MSMSWLPNALTLMRCVLAFAVAGAVLQGAALSHAVNAALADWMVAGSPPPGDPAYPQLLAETGLADMLTWPAIAFAAFVLAALTDLFDGILSRALEAQSAFGAWLDPIADKLLVGLSLVALALAGATLWIAIPAAVIICRDVYVTWLRTRLGGGYALPVMQAAKWKTALEMIAIGTLLGEHKVNISQFELSRNMPGGRAMSIIRVDTPISRELLEQLNHVPNIVAVGSDVDTRGNTRTGSVLIERMTVAGQ
jgi:CDP-diacylglycerol--glycerol-3-phosphate 3-phosphatidyltransferase